MTVAKVSSSGLWIESPAADAGLPTPAVWQDDNADAWSPAVTGSADADAIDIGEGPTLFDVTAPWILISDGAGGLVTASSGTAAGILISDGAGGLVTSTDTTLDVGGSLLTDGAGDVHAVPDDAPRGGLLFLSETFITY